LSGPDIHFVTEIEGIEGTWPDPPRWWSFSSFREGDECPRRWALTRATYPTIWEKAGYPDRPYLAAVVGDTVHAALEEIVRALVAQGLDNTASAPAVDVLRALGGYSGVIERSIAATALKLQANPRMAPRFDALLRDLRSHVPDMRQRTQAALSRTRLVPRIGQPRLERTGTGISNGSYPEYDITSSALAWAGRVDLLTIDGQDVHILDYKTGAPSDHHADQLRVYALLWFRRDGPPDVPPRATKLTLSYPTHDVDVPAPTEEELLVLEHDLVDRGTALRLDLEHDRPARPQPDACTFCSVRHLCDVYWRALPMATEGPTDAEVTIKSRNGPRSFRARVAHTHEDVLIRTGEDTSMPSGSRWRVLNGYGVRDDDGVLGISVTASSELYPLRSS
jgi:RecB family exonuclease